MISIFGVWRSTRANYKSWKFSNPIISQILKLGFLAFDVEYFKIRISHFFKKILQGGEIASKQNSAAKTIEFTSQSYSLKTFLIRFFVF